MISRRTATRAIACAIFIAVFILGWIVAVNRQVWGRPPFAEQAAIALHLVHGDGFASPFDPQHNAPLSSWTPPIYPAIIALVEHFTGINTHRTIAILLGINCACYGAIAAGLFVLGEKYFGLFAGLLAAYGIAIHPIFLTFSADFWDSFCALAVFVWLLIAVARGPGVRRIYLYCAAVGLLLGIHAQINAAYSAAYPVLLLALVRKRPRAIQFRSIAFAIIAFVVALSPWTIRNVVAFHRLIYVRGGASFELWQANQPGAIGWMERSILVNHPHNNPAERKLLLTLGEPRYFDLCRRRFFAEYQQNPTAFWARTARRACYLFLSEPTRTPASYPLLYDIRWHGYVIDRLLMNAFFATGGLAGVYLAARQRRGVSWIFLAGLLAEFPFFFAAVGDRYTLPLRAILVLFTAGLFEMARKSYFDHVHKKTKDTLGRDGALRQSDAGL